LISSLKTTETWKTYEPLNTAFDTRKGKNQFSKVRFLTGIKDISAHINVLIIKYTVLGRKKNHPKPILTKMCVQDQFVLL